MTKPTKNALSVKKSKRTKSLPASLAIYDLARVGAKLPGKPAKDKRAKKAKQPVKVQNTLFENPQRKKALLNTLQITNMKLSDYLPSSKDKNELVVVKPVALLQGGSGLYATTGIQGGVILGRYTGKQFTKSAYEQYLENNPDADTNYAITVDNFVVDAIQQGNFTRFINCSDTQSNVEFQKDEAGEEGCIKVVTKRYIPNGAQILVDYNVYDEQSAKEYFFVNPGDGTETTSEIQQKNSDVYSRMAAPEHYQIFNIESGDDLCVTEFAEVILQGGKLDDVFAEGVTAVVNLPCIRYDGEGRLFDFHEADIFSALMMSCYLGQLENVQWLVAHKASVNQQQHRSGNCALFCALAGYASSRRRDKERYLNIIMHLITNGANILVCDREEKTFLHQAMSMLSEGDCKIIIDHIHAAHPDVLQEASSYLDANNNDLMMIILREKSFAKFAYLLTVMPNYMDVVTIEEKDNIEDFRNAINDFTPNEKKKLMGIFSENGIKISEEVLVAVGLKASKRRKCCGWY